MYSFRFTKFSILLLIYVFLLIPMQESMAQDHAVGVDGIKGASLPGPGMSYRMTNMYYHADSTKDANGNDSDGDFNVTVFSNVHDILYITKKKILGAEYGWHVIVPLVYKDMKITPPGIDDNRLALGDIVVKPLLLSWKKERVTTLFRFDIQIPTGEHVDNIDNAANPGSDHWAFRPVLGTNFYLTPEKDWSLSLLWHYEYHLENRHDEIQYGSDLILEYGLSHSFSPLTEVGVAGYAVWQVTDDKGDDVNYDSSVHDKVYSIGIEATHFVPSIGMKFMGKVLKEFKAEDRPEGYSIWFNIVKPFNL